MNSEELLYLYRRMLLIRRMEEQLGEVVKEAALAADKRALHI